MGWWLARGWSEACGCKDRASCGLMHSTGWQAACRIGRGWLTEKPAALSRLSAAEDCPRPEGVASSTVAPYLRARECSAVASQDTTASNGLLGCVAN